MTVRIPVRSIVRMEVDRGRKSNVGWGALAGVLGGGLLGFATSGGDTDSPGFQSAVTVVGAAAGAGLGALIGAAVRTTRWEAVDADRLQLAVTPNPRGFGVQVSLRF